MADRTGCIEGCGCMCGLVCVAVGIVAVGGAFALALKLVNWGMN